MTSGFLDENFGTNGTINSSLNYDYVTIQSLKSQSNKIVVCGKYYTSNEYYIFLARYNQNGQIDTTFGVNGYVMTNYIANESSNSDMMIIQSTGKIIVLCENNGNFSLIRFLINGDIDTSFGTNGIVDTGYTFDSNYFCSIKKTTNN